MADFLLVSTLVVFVALCVAYVAWCDHIIGVDDTVVVSATEPAPAPSGIDAGVSSAVGA